MERVEKQPSFHELLANRNLVLLWAGQNLSLVGDTFYMIAIPWMVLQLTGDALSLGTMMAVAGIPRAVFMLLGGAFSDRYPPRRIMLISDVLRLVLTGAIVVLILTGGIRIWMLYLFSLAFGTVSGFFQPASAAIVPQIVERDNLAPANSLLQGTGQLCTFIGPALAGALIAAFSQRADTMTGIALAIGVDCLSFLISVLTLLPMRIPAQIARREQAGQGSMLRSIGEGLKFLWRDVALQVVFILLVTGNFLFAGPFVVGVPILANTRLAGGAAAYGLIGGSYSGGNLVGMILAGFLRMKGKPGRFFLGFMFFAFGSALASFAVVGATWLAVAIMIAIGVGNGILGITLYTFLQKNTPAEMMGRMMSIISLASLGLAPLSQALSGVVMKVSLPWTFVGAGMLMALVGGWALASRNGKSLEKVFA